MPYWGGLRPLVPLAHAARRSGHRVAVAAPAWFGPTIARHGLDHVGAGLGRVPERLDRLFVDLQAGQADEWGWVFATWVGGLYCQYMAADLLALASDWKPDVIVREATEFGGCLAAEALGIPHAAVRPRPASSRLSYQLRAGLAPVLRLRRRELGLPPDRGNRMPHRYLELAFLPPSFFGGAALFSDRTHFVDFGLDGLDATPAPDADRRSGGRPTVYASLGTLWYREQGALETIVSALSREPVDVVVSAGDEDVAARLRSVVAARAAGAGSVTVHPSVDQLSALRAADVFVTHAGINSVREALSLGVPMVVVPIRGDQPFNAGRCVSLGVARGIAVHELRPGRVREAVRAVLESPTYREASTRARGSVAALPPVARAVELLEELVAGGRPIPRPARSVTAPRR
jgi:N-glycosyltransferase